MAKAGTASIEILADFSTLKRQIRAEMNRLGQEDIHVGVDVDTSELQGFERTIKKVRAETKTPIEQTLAGDFDTGGFARWAAANDKAEAEARARKIETHLGFEIDESQLARYRAIKEQIKRDAGRKEAFKLHLGADFDDRAFAAFNRQTSDADRNLNRVTRSARGTDSAFGSLGKSASSMFGRTFKFSTRIPIVGLTAMGKVAYDAAGGLISLAGALAPLSGLLGAIGPLALSAAQGIGTIKLATSGVSDAISAAFTEQDKAAVSSSASLKQQTASVEAVREANLSLATAQRTAKGAQQDLNQARSDATREIEDMRASLRQLSLDEEGASLSLKEAKQALRDLTAQGAGDLEIERASLRIREAREELKKTRTESKRTRDDLGKAEQGGVKGMPQVVQARQSLADANRAVAEAERELTNATKASTEALAGSGSAADLAAQKLAKLPPAAQSFVKFIVGLRPEIKKLQGIAAQGLFPGVEQGIRAATVNMPVLEKIVGRTSKAFGELAKQAGKRLGSKEWGRDLEIQGARNEVTIRRLGTAGLNLAEAFKDVSLAAGPMVSSLTKWVVALTAGWKESAKSADGQKRLAAFFKDATKTFFETVHILADLGVAFKNIGSAARRAFGNELLGNIALGAKNLREWTGTVEGQKELVAIFEDIGESLKRAGRFVRDLVGDFRDMKAQGKTTGEALGNIFGDVVAGAVGKVFNSAPRIAEALVRGFLQADVWGKLIGGAFLISRFGGVGAWKAIGAKLGLGLGAGVSEGAAAGIVGGGTGGAAGGAAAGGLLGTLRSKLLPVAKRAGLIGVGIALADSVLGEFSRRADLKGPDAFKALKAAQGADPFGLFSAADATVFKVTGLLEHVPVIKSLGNWSSAFSDSEKAAKKLVPQLESIVKTGKGISSDKARELREELAKLDGVSGDTRRELGALVDRAAALGKFKAEFGIKFNADTPLRTIHRLSDAFHDLTTHTTASLTTVARIVDRNTKIIARELGTNTKKGRDALRKNFELAEGDIQSLMRSSLVSAKDGAAAIQALFVKYLGTFGIKGKAARFYMKLGGRGTGIIPGHPDQSPGSGHKLQAGGLVNVPGTGIGDKVAARVPVGTGVINRKAANVLLEPGEKLVPPETVRKMGGPGVIHAINRAVPRFQRGGVIGDERRGGIIDLLRALPGLARGGIAGMVAAANRLEKAHFPYKWGGGHQASPAPFGPMDCSGAVSFVLQQAGVKIPTMVSGALATAGKAGAGRNATVFANAGHTFMRIGRRFFGTSGTNPGGGAGWFEDPGADYRAGFAQRHFGVGDVDVPKIPRVEVGGPDSALKAGVQSGLNATRNAAQRALKKAASSLGLPIGTGDPAPAGEFSKGELMRLWLRAGGSSNTARIAAAVAMAESGGRSDATNTNSDGSIDRGLWQINSIHGGLSTLDPLANAKAAVEISGGGSNWNPWTVFKSGAYRQFLAKGGVVGYVGDSLGVGTAPYLKGRVGKLVAKVLEGRRSPAGIGILKGMLGDRFDRYVLDLGTNDPDAGTLSRSLKKADKLTDARLLMVPTVNGPKAQAKNAAIRGLAGRDDIDLFEWAKRSKGLVGPDGIHAETGGDYSKRAAMLAGALKAATRKHDKAKGAAKLSGTLTHKLRQTLGSKKPKTVDKLVRQIKKLGLPKKWMDQIARYGKDHERFSDFANSANLISPDDGTGAVINGLNEMGWLTKDLEAQFKMRNLLVKARDFVVRRRGEVARTLKLAEARFEALSTGKTPHGWRGPNPAKDSLKKWNALPQPKRMRGMRDWERKKGQLPGNREFDRKSGKLESQPSSRLQALRKLVPKLKTQRAILQGGLGNKDNPESILGGLSALQGFGPPGLLRSPWPIGTVFGGTILDTQHSLQGLGAKPDVTDSATAEGDTRRADILAELLREANLRTAVSERQFDVLRNFPPFGGQFATGGIVDAPRGAPRTAVVHGQEGVFTPDQMAAMGAQGDTNVHLHFKPGTEWLRQFVQVEVEHGTRKQARKRVLPGQGGGRLK